VILRNSLFARTLALLLLAGILAGCDDTGGRTFPTVPAPSPIAPTPPSTPIGPAQTGSIHGVVTEITAAGPRPVEGVIVAVSSCAQVNCGGSRDLSVARETMTGWDGSYRLIGLFNTDLNYIWLGPYEQFRSGEPRPVLPCDVCDVILTVNGDTRLDIKVVRP
jgi:hypothetical protein